MRASTVRTIRERLFVISTTATSLRRFTDNYWLLRPLSCSFPRTLNAAVILELNIRSLISCLYAHWDLKATTLTYYSQDFHVSRTLYIFIHIYMCVDRQILTNTYNCHCSLGNWILTRIFRKCLCSFCVLKVQVSEK